MLIDGAAASKLRRGVGVCEADSTAGLAPYWEVFSGQCTAMYASTRRIVTTVLPVSVRLSSVQAQEWFSTDTKLPHQSASKVTERRIHLSSHSATFICFRFVF